MTDAPPLVIEPLNLTELVSAISTALAGEDTHVFLDTSTLIWLYRLHKAARQEVIDWITSGAQAGRVHIPRRALHEFSRHRQSPAVLRPFKQQLKQLPSLLKQLDQWAHLITDDARAVECGFASRAEYFTLIKETTKQTNRVLKPIITDSGLAELDAELIPIFNSLALNSNIYEGLGDLRREYEARVEARMPPGYKDAKKGKRSLETEPSSDDLEDIVSDLYGANRFGDLGIWEEIIAFCKAEESIGEVVIITHDQKPDWSYAPIKIIDIDGHTKSNFQGAARITVAQPLLAHEIQIRAKVEGLHVITVPQLAWVASQSTSLSLTELARAVQVEAEAAIDAVANDSKDLITGEVGDGIAAAPIAQEHAGDAMPEPVVEILPEAAVLPGIDDPLAEFLATPPVNALADRMYTRDVSGSAEFDKVIASLKSSNWYVQNPAAVTGIKLLEAGGITYLQAFIFGRNIYQAACGGAGTPISMLENIGEELTGVSDDLSNVVYAGALFEAYFNKDGEIRSRPKSGQITSLFLPQDIPRFRPAIDWIISRLDLVSDKYLMLPSPNPQPRTLDLQSDGEGHLIGISVDGFALTEPADENLNAEALPLKTNYERLREVVSRHFAIPKNQFLLLPGFAGRLECPNLQLKHWGPNTEVTFPAP